MYFEVIAISKFNGKKSAITNLNTIISEIIYPILNTTQVEETFLFIEDLQISKNLFDSAIDILNDTSWVDKYLEYELDEDFCDRYENCNENTT
jgi:hypothetical protein